MILRGERDNNEGEQNLFQAMSESMPDLQLAKSLISAGLQMSYISKLDLFHIMDKLSEIETLELLTFLAESGYDFKEELEEEWQLELEGSRVTSRVAMWYLMRNGTGRKHPDDITFLGRATIRNELNILKCLVDPRYCNIKPNEKELIMCLLEASRRGKLGTIECLLNIEDRPQLDRKSCMRLALSSSCKAGNLDISNFWLEHGKISVEELERKNSHQC